MLDLPSCLVQLVSRFLGLRSLPAVSATCRALHAQLLGDEAYTRRRLDEFVDEVLVRDSHCLPHYALVRLYLRFPFLPLRWPAIQVWHTPVCDGLPALVYEDGVIPSTDSIGFRVSYALYHGREIDAEFDELRRKKRTL